MLCLSVLSGTAVSLLSVPSARADQFSTKYDAYFQAANRQFRPEGPDWKWDKAQGVQESRLNPLAISPVGAAGVMQIMPGTWAQITKALGWGNVSVQSAQHNIFGGVFYQTSMDRIWRGRGRSIAERHDLGLASFNAGAGWILSAQYLCGDARDWSMIAPCLPAVTGPANAKQTADYVRLISRWRSMLE